MHTLPFLPNFEWAFVRMDTVNVLAKLEFRSFAHSWDNRDGSFGGCEPQSWGRGGRKGSALVPFERALVSSYRPSIATAPLPLHVSEILPLFCFTTPLFPAPPLLISEKFHYIPPGVGEWLSGYEERRRRANSPCN